MDYYKVTPRIVPADKLSELRIEPMFRHAEFRDPEKLVIVCHPYDGLLEDGSYENYSWTFIPPRFPALEWRMDGRTLVVRCFFAGEQEHNIKIGIKDAESGKITLFTRIHVYSVKEDLYRLRPFRGNFHIHSTGSDGREEPRYVAARFRQLGMDFCAVSDHGNYAPSIEAKEYWKDRNPDFKLYPGEEVHAIDNPVHIIHFGGAYSINDLWRENEARYRAEVEEIRKGMTDVAPGVDSFAVAASEWVFDNIRKAGGLCVFCHPYWYTECYVLNEGITSEIFKRRKFDAFELLGGFYKYQAQSNNHQIVRYYEEAAKGGPFPVVGLDDSHGTDAFAVEQNKVGSRTCDLAGWYSTMVFAESDSVEDLVSAIRAGYSAAVEKIEGESIRVYSSFRLTKYAAFLMRYYFPMHDVLCADEGALMLRLLAGEEAAGKALQALRGSVGKYRQDAFRG